MKPSNLDCFVTLVMIPWEFAPLPCKFLKIMVISVCIGGILCLAIPLDIKPIPCKLFEFVGIGMFTLVLGRYRG